MMGNRFTPYLYDLENPNPFPGIKSLETRTGKKISLRMGGNESLDAPLSFVRDDFGRELANLARLYGDPASTDLRAGLERIYGFNPDELSLDSGADSVIALCLRALCTAGDTVICSAGTYPSFAYFARACGCRVIEVPYRQSSAGPVVDIDALLECSRRHKARVIYLANPDNPTGSWLESAQVARILGQLEEQTTLLLDEAYIDFCADLAEGKTQSLPNCIRIRSLSKSHALAGLRIGFALASPAFITQLNKVKIHYSLSHLSQHLALLALEDRVGFYHLLGLNKEIREIFSRYMKDYGYTVIPSGTNFVSLLLPDASSAESLQEYFLDSGIAVHRPAHTGFGNLIRVTLCNSALTPYILNLFETRPWIKN